jgi:hypothetical protein
MTALPEDIASATPPETEPGLSPAQAHRLRHYAGLTALHIGLALRSLHLGNFRLAAQNHAMAMEAMRLAVEGP